MKFLSLIHVLTSMLSLLCAVAYGDPAVASTADVVRERSTVPDADSNRPLEKIKVPPGSISQDPNVRRTTDEFTAASSAWAAGLREYLRSRSGPRTELVAAYTRENFQALLDLEKKRELHFEAVSRWQDAFEAHVPGLEQARNHVEAIDTESLTPLERSELRAYLRASEQLLTLESEAEAEISRGAGE